MEELHKTENTEESPKLFGQNLPEIEQEFEDLRDEDDPYKGMIFPSLLTRVKALVIDAIVLLILFSLASILIDKFEHTPTYVRVFIFVFAFYIYEPLFVTLFGGTIGHHILGVNVKQINRPQQKINALQAIVRFLTKYLLGWISFLTLIGNKRKRGIHDLASGSIVLYK